MSISASNVTQKLSALSLEEKIHITTGGAWFETFAVDHADVSKVVMSDGPHGLRLEGPRQANISTARAATCFPPAVALGSTWDVSLASRVGEALGEEARVEGVHVILGPGINLKRTPLCGRNFEYFSEDPFLSALFGEALVNGIQSQGVGTSLKHFAANNQETLRMTVSAEIDERTLHEMYLRAFEHVIRNANPWTVMCSYNRINGTYASENEWLLTTLLREKWGYQGLVVSDWGAVLERARALRAGLDLEMPKSFKGPKELAASIEVGSTSIEQLDTAVRRVLELAERASQVEPLDTYNVHEHHQLAREVGARSIVLLKNEDSLLPLDPTGGLKIAVVGEFARTPRYQGDGSSRVTPSQLDNALEALAIDSNAQITFAPGFPIDGTVSSTSELHDEAVAIAKDADVVLAFIGLSAIDESEGYDRQHIDIQPEQIALIKSLLKVNAKVVVILSNGSAVKLSGWSDEVPALVESWLLGQAGGSAIADVLYGRVNPSGRLTETLPLRLEDTPAFENFPGEHDMVRYAEGIFVGYRYYDHKKMNVSYPFGHGLSYTTFSYENFEAKSLNGGIEVSLNVRNTGEHDGHEIVQLYVSSPKSRVARAPQELKALASVYVKSGEVVPVTLTVKRSDLAYFDIQAHDWIVEGLNYIVHVGASSRDLRASTTVAVAPDNFYPRLTMNSTFAQWMEHELGGPALKAALAKYELREEGIVDVDSIIYKMASGFRLQQFIDLFRLPLTSEDIEILLAQTAGE